jgi:hypothetical protein
MSSPFGAPHAAAAGEYVAKWIKTDAPADVFFQLAMLVEAASLPRPRRATPADLKKIAGRQHLPTDKESPA